MSIKGKYLYEEAQNRLEELKKIKKQKEEDINKMPPGKIHIIKSRKQIQYYLRMNHTDKSGKYLSKDQTDIIRKYVQKAYDEKVLKEINKEIKCIEAFLKKSKESVRTIQEIYSSNPKQVKAFIQPIDCSDEDYIEWWINKPYEGKIIKNEGMQLTERGEMVRSKSELNIANALYRNGIPYKYECPLKLKRGIVIYPDFTVLDVKHRKEIFWEHRGMMDDRDYAKHTVQRVREYQKNDIWLGSNLLITEETSTYALGTKEIEDIIRYYFLNI